MLKKFLVPALALALLLGPATAKAQEDKAPELLSLTVLVRDGMVVLWTDEARLQPLAVAFRQVFDSLGLDQVPAESLRLDQLLPVLEDEAVRGLARRTEIFRPLVKSGEAEGSPKYRLRDLEARGLMPVLEYATDAVFQTRPFVLNDIACRYGWSVSALDWDSSSCPLGRGVMVSGPGPGATLVILP